MGSLLYLLHQQTPFNPLNRLLKKTPTDGFTQNTLLGNMTTDESD